MKRFHIITFILAAIMACSCSKDDEPQQLKVNIHVTIAPNESSPAVSPGQDWRRRFIVDIYRPDNLTSPLDRRVILYDDIKENGDEIRLPVTFVLNPADYLLAIWSDYIPVATDEDFYYSTSSLSDIFLNSPYVGNTTSRMAFAGSAYVKLSEFSGENNVVAVNVDTYRPMAPVRLVATDYDRFVARHGADVANDAIIRIDYDSYLPIGYNVFTGLPQRSETGISFETPLAESQKIEEGTLIASDLLLVGNEDLSSILTISVYDSEYNLLRRSSNLKGTYRKGYLTTLRGNFLTGGSDLSVDTEYDEDIVIDLD